MGEQLQLNLKFVGKLENDLNKGDKIVISDNINAEVKDVYQQGLGFGANQVIIEYLFNIFFIGVPSSIIATLIYDSILKGKNKLIDEKREVVIISKKELIEYIDKIKNEYIEKKG